ncbi:MAG: hypothetical protein R3Y59_08830 [bacterium]
MKRCYFVRLLLLVMLCISAGEGLKAQNQYISETFSLNALPSEWADDLDQLSDSEWTYSDGFALFDGGY